MLRGGFTGGGWWCSVNLISNWRNVSGIQ